MKILHTADLHIGQILYQSYSREEEHNHFFDQLKNWCVECKPDALLVSGDVFDIQQPSAAVKRMFNEFFVGIHNACPEMHIIITAGNHDSPSRLNSDTVLWEHLNTKVVGYSPSVEMVNTEEGWEDQYIVNVGSGYVVALPYMPSERQDTMQKLLDRVAQLNGENKPVVLMAHTAITNADVTGHGFEIGTIRTQDVDSMGQGYDYLALGHIHKPQTLGHIEDSMTEEVQYDAPVARYSGSALHVSCDEKFPHSVSLVDIDHHGGKVSIKQLRIDELLHFYELPEGNGAFESADEAIASIGKFCDTIGRGYIRLRIKHNTVLPPNFLQMVYDEIELKKVDVRYNPKLIWVGDDAAQEVVQEKLTFQVAELQEMTDPMQFLTQIIDELPGFTIEELGDLFEEVKCEVAAMEEDEKAKTAKKTKSSTTKSE